MTAAIMKALEDTEKHFLLPEDEVSEFGFNDPKSFGRHIFIGNFPESSVYTDSFLAITKELKICGMVRGNRYDKQPLYPGATEGKLSFWLLIKEVA